MTLLTIWLVITHFFNSCYRNIAQIRLGFSTLTFRVSAKLFCLLNSRQQLEYSLNISFTTGIKKKPLVSLTFFWQLNLSAVLYFAFNYDSYHNFLSKDFFVLFCFFFLRYISTSFQAFSGGKHLHYPCQSR